MSASLASFRSSVDNFALQHAVLADEMMESSSRPVIVTALKNSTAADDHVAALQFKNKILAMVAHELRSPLTPLRLATHILRTASADRPDLLRLIDMIDRQIGGIARLSEDLIDATRVAQGTLRLSNANVEVIAVLADPCETTSAAVVAQGQTFTIEMPDRTLRIEGDPVRLTQAVNNLLHNAVKYTPAHGNIKMTVLAEGKDLVISVSDSGLGISDALLPHIFDLFAQSSRTIVASAGGLGVGLAVVKAIAESHGGSVSATSAGPGAGSKFTLRLPIIAKHCVTCDSA